MEFNKEQKEGIGRLCDTLAATAIVGATVAMTGHSSLSQIEIGGLITSTAILVCFGLLLRRKK